MKSNNEDYEVGSVLDRRVKFEPPYAKHKIHQLITTDTAIQKVFAFIKQDTSNAQETIQISTAHAKKNPS